MSISRSRIRSTRLAFAAGLAACALGANACSSDDAGAGAPDGAAAGTAVDGGLGSGSGSSSSSGTVPDAATAVAPESADDPPPAPLACTKHVGTGTGRLEISQTAQALVAGDVLCIAAGDYDTFTIADIEGTAAAPIVIQNDGVVTIHDLSGMSNLSHVVFSGAGTGATATANGIAFTGLPYRALQLTGRFDDLTLRWFDLTDVPDNSILFKQDEGQHVAYDGTDATVLRRDIHVLHVRAKHTNAFFSLGSSIDGAGVQDVAKGVEVAYCTITDAPDAGGVIYLGGAWGVDVHHNRILNVATNVAAHNGIVAITGDGKLHHNYYRGLLGNGLRAWPVSLDARGTLDVYDNIFLESNKYSAFEVQAFDAVVNANQYTHPVDVRIFNNTAGNVNLGTNLPAGYGPWVGAIVDSYAYFGGTLEVSNNLGYHIVDPQADSDASRIVNYESDGAPTVHDNLIFATWQAAGLVDDVSGNVAAGSAVIGAGVPMTGLEDDFYGRPRTQTPDVGACEH